MQQKEGQKKRKNHHCQLEFFFRGKFCNLVRKKNEDAKVTKGFLGEKVGPSWHFIIHQIMGGILNFSTFPLTSSQIWLNPLVHDCQPTTSPAVFPTDHTTKSCGG